MGTQEGGSKRRERKAGAVTPAGAGSWVLKKRTAKRMSREMLARKCRCTETLIWYAEKGWPVHPVFADRIARALGGTEAERDSIVAEKHRRGAPAEPVKTLRERQNITLKPGGGWSREKRPIVEIDRNGAELARFAGMHEAARISRIHVTQMRDRCQRKLSRDEFRTFGVTWRYADEWDAMTDEERQKDIERGV